VQYFAVSRIYYGNITRLFPAFTVKICIQCSLAPRLGWTKKYQQYKELQKRIDEKLDYDEEKKRDGNNASYIHFYACMDVSDQYR
jgi:hypothetical protein